MTGVAHETGSPLVALPAVFLGQGLPVSRVMLDRVHPNTLGHEIIARALFQEMGSALPERRPESASE